MFDDLQIILACPSSPLTPVYGDLSVSGLVVGSTAIVTCDRGYIVNGSSVRHCTSMGWDGIPADCVPVCK